MSEGQSTDWEGPALQQVCQARGNGFVMACGELSGSWWRQHPQDVVGARAGAKEQEEPRSLQVLQFWETRQELLMGGRKIVEVLADENVRSQGRPQNDHAFLCCWQPRVPDPHVGPQAG